MVGLGPSPPPLPPFRVGRYESRQWGEGEVVNDRREFDGWWLL